MEKVQDNEKFRRYLIEKQLIIPPRLYSLANKYPTVSWVKSQQFYEECVIEVLNKYEIDCLNDIPYGKGYYEASVKFESMLYEESVMNLTNKQKFKICDLIFEKLNHQYTNEKESKELNEIHDKLFYSLL